MVKCVLCDREAFNVSLSLCKYHYQAYLNLKKKYPIWKERMNVSFGKYINLLEKNPYTGKWIKDVIKYIKRLRSDDSRENYKTIV